MKLAIALAGFLLPSACTAGIAVVPTPSPSSPITAADLSGAWVFGDANEPAAGPVVACNPFKIWNLTQTGGALKGSVNACIGPCAAFTEETTGTTAGGTVRLTGEAAEHPAAAHTPVAYELRFDAATQHLVGTRNGQPFWAAPFIQQTTGCGPRPL